MHANGDAQFQNTVRHFAFGGPMYKIETGVKMPKVRRPRGSVPTPAVNAINAYRKAYSSVYFKAPFIEYDEGWFKLEGERVNRKRLREMTKSLNMRRLGIR